MAAIGWIQVSQLSTHPREKWEEIALWIHSVIFSLLGLLAVFGFLGCLIKSRGMVRSFAVALALHFGFSLASGVFTLYTLFRQSPQEVIDKCVNGSEDPEIVQGCSNGVGLMKGLMVAIYVITWLVQIYAYFVVERYVDQLDDEEMAHGTVVIPRTMVDVSVHQPSAYNGYNSAAPYPFATPRNAHGVGSGEDPSNRV